MKYLMLILSFLALSACDQNTFDPQGKDHKNAGGIPAQIDGPLQAKVSQHGLYRMVRSSGIVDDPDTTTGKVVANPVIEMVKSTERIPLIKGAQMYLQYRIWPLPDQPAYVNLRRVLKHPEMTLPDGSVTTGSDFEIKRKVSSNHVIVYTGYGFDEDYELVEGEWIFEIWFRDQKLIEQKFITYWPDAEEIAELAPTLELGNKVLTRVDSPNNPDPKKNWPRVIVEEQQPDTPTGVSEAILDMQKPIVQP